MIAKDPKTCSPGRRSPFPAALTRPSARFAAWEAFRPSSSAGRAPHIWDADGNEYIDYVGSWGPLLLGHRHPDILKAIEEAARHAAPALARPPSAKSNWPRPSAKPCRPSKWSAWSTPAPRPP